MWSAPDPGSAPAPPAPESPAASASAVANAPLAPPHHASGQVANGGNGRGASNSDGSADGGQWAQHHADDAASAGGDGLPPGHDNDVDSVEDAMHDMDDVQPYGTASASDMYADAQHVDLGPRPYLGHRDVPVLSEGFLWKKGGGFGLFSRRNWKRRYFVMRGYQLAYYAAPSSRAAKGIIDLADATVTGVIQLAPLTARWWWFLR